MQHSQHTPQPACITAERTPVKGARTVLPLPNPSPPPSLPNVTRPVRAPPHPRVIGRQLGTIPLTARGLDPPRLVASFLSCGGGPCLEALDVSPSTASRARTPSPHTPTISFRMHHTMRHTQRAHARTCTHTPIAHPPSPFSVFAVRVARRRGFPLHFCARGGACRHG